jgi:hypothetical protein
MSELAAQSDRNIRIRTTTPPRLFTMIIAVGKSDATCDWMMRNSITSYEIEAAAWRTFLFTLLLAFGSLVALFLLFGTRTLIYTLLPAFLVPLLFANRVANSPSKQANKEQRAYLRESPGTIGTLVMNMRIQPSLEWAMGRVSHTCSGELTKRFVRLGWEVLTRRSDSLEQALLTFIPRLSGRNDAIGRSLHLVLASTYEPDAASRDRVLDRANHITMEGVKEAADHYVASLSNPALIIFALGIMLPVMLFSTAPLLSLGSVSMADAGDANSTFDQGWLFFMLLVIVPLGCLLFANNALSRNPFAEVPRFALPLDIIMLAPIGLSTVLSIFFVILVQGELLPYCLTLSVYIPLCAAIRLRSGDIGTFQKDGQRAGFISALFQMGSRMAGGTSFEKSLEEIAIVGKRTPFGGCANRALRRARLDRMGLSELLEVELSAVSGKDIAQAFTVVARAAEKDPHYAGKLAINLAHNFSDIRAAELKIEENLHGVVDMMRSTGMVFAPIVLGVTSSLVAITVGAGFTSSSTVDLQIILAMIYLTELVFCVSYFTNFLHRDRTWGHLANDFALRCPVALLVFTAVSLFARTGLSQLM